MKSVHRIPRRNEGVTWRVAGDLNKVYLRIEVRRHKTADSIDRAMKRTDYESGQYPFDIPIYRIDDVGCVR